MEWFIGLLLGHLAGDYIFQNDWMALNKKNNLLACMTHCWIYTLCVCLGLYLFGLPLNNLTMCLNLFNFIFLSHFILDYTYLVDKWMKFYGARSWDTCIPTRLNNEGKEVLAWDNYLTAEQVVKTAFGAFLYIAVDNTSHLIMMTIFIKYFFI